MAQNEDVPAVEQSPRKTRKARDSRSRKGPNSAGNNAAEDRSAARGRRKPVFAAPWYAVCLSIVLPLSVVWYAMVYLHVIPKYVHNKFLGVEFFPPTPQPEPARTEYAGGAAPSLSPLSGSPVAGAARTRQKPPIAKTIAADRAVPEPDSLPVNFPPAKIVGQTPAPAPNDQPNPNPVADAKAGSTKDVMSHAELSKAEHETPRIPDQRPNPRDILTGATLSIDASVVPGYNKDYNTCIFVEVWDKNSALRLAWLSDGGCQASQAKEFKAGMSYTLPLKVSQARQVTQLMAEGFIVRIWQQTHGLTSLQLHDTFEFDATVTLSFGDAKPLTASASGIKLINNLPWKKAKEFSAAVYPTEALSGGSVH
jgi:hypothetical protein